MGQQLLNMLKGHVASEVPSDKEVTMSTNLFLTEGGL